MTVIFWISAKNGPKMGHLKPYFSLFPVFSIYGRIAKNSVDRMGIKYNILQFIKCQW